MRGRGGRDRGRGRGQGRVEVSSATLGANATALAVDEGKENQEEVGPIYQKKITNYQIKELMKLFGAEDPSPTTWDKATAKQKIVAFSQMELYKTLKPGAIKNQLANLNC